jgi:alpha-tubulin suppressor-like RCC1 family protein
MSLETRRMLRATAENIALEVTGELFTMTGNYRKGDWNRQVFERMKKHNEMLRGLEKPIRQKALLKK